MGISNTSTPKQVAHMGHGFVGVLQAEHRRHAHPRRRAETWPDRPCRLFPDLGEVEERGEDGGVEKTSLPEGHQVHLRRGCRHPLRIEVGRHQAGWEVGVSGQPDDEHRVPPVEVPAGHGRRSEADRTPTAKRRGQDPVSLDAAFELQPVLGADLLHVGYRLCDCAHPGDGVRVAGLVGERERSVRRRARQSAGHRPGGGSRGRRHRHPASTGLPSPWRSPWFGLRRQPPGGRR